MQRNKYTNNIGLKFLSFIIAIILWFVVLGSRNVEVTKEVPIEVITPSDLVVANEASDRVAFRLSGPKAFLRNLINRKEVPIKVDLTSAKPGLVTYRFYSDNIQVPIGVKVLSINPTAVLIKLESLKKREVPLRLVTIGKPEPEYRITRVDLLKNTIKIKGPASKVDQVVELPTKQIQLSDLKASSEHEVAVDLDRYPGVLLDDDLPRLHVEVVQSTANFKIKKVAVRVLTKRRYKVEPNELTLYVQSTAKELKRLDRSQVYGVVHLNNRPAGKYEETPVIKINDLIRVIRTVPSKVNVTLY